MNLFQSLREECIQVNPEVSDKSSVLRKVAKLAKESPILNKISEDEIFNALMEREKLGSTGFGNAIALPHCSLKNISEFVIGMISLPAGVEFESLDGEKVKLVMFIISPHAQRNNHIKYLAAISRALSIPGILDELLVATDANQLRERLLSKVQSPKSKEPLNKNFLMHVVVQEEEKFNDILTIFTEKDQCSVTVLDSKNACDYLSRMPLFASFWTEQEEKFSRIILSVVNKAFLNEILRQINLVHDLSENQGVMVMVQDIYYIDGSLNF